MLELSSIDSVPRASEVRPHRSYTMQGEQSAGTISFVQSLIVTLEVAPALSCLCLCSREVVAASNNSATACTSRTDLLPRSYISAITKNQSNTKAAHNTSSIKLENMLTLLALAALTAAAPFASSAAPGLSSEFTLQMQYHDKPMSLGAIESGKGGSLYIVGFDPDVYRGTPGEPIYQSSFTSANGFQSR